MNGGNGIRDCSGLFTRQARTTLHENIGVRVAGLWNDRTYNRTAASALFQQLERNGPISISAFAATVSRRNCELSDILNARSYRYVRSRQAVH